MTRNADRSSDLPLADLRVIELGTLIAAPFAGRILADFGAEVLKVEHPVTGDPLRSWGKPAPGGDSLWSMVQSRGKRSLALDLHDPEAQQVVRSLAEVSDVLLENFRPGRLEGWGLDPDTLLARNPSLVVIRISGYGQTGPLRDQPGFGTVAEAAGGMRYVTGDPDRPPTRVGLSLGDTIASLQALVGGFVALHERQRSGRGQVVDVALTEAVLSTLEGILPEYGYYGAVRERTGDLAHNSAPTNAYPTADGSYVCIGANNDGLFTRLFEFIGRHDLAHDPALATNPGRVARAAELDAAIGTWTRQRSPAEVVALLREVGIPVGKINSVADIAADPQLRSRDMLVEVADDRLDRPLLVPGVVPKLSRTPGAVRGLGPPIGADNAVVEELVERTRPDIGRRSDD